MAEQAGLGWFGEAYKFLSQDIGSWYFLSEILVDIELPKSEIADNHCGSCKSCIDIALPCDRCTLCFGFKKMHFYLTIELKGVIPKSLEKPSEKDIWMR
ncbi:MAG: hypothetical protein CM1200mP16_06270 [Nitrospina sp.]|nr:MAG: hypothetical protein CM1200mP16_06270 [Nitrospina sp.]